MRWSRVTTPSWKTTFGLCGRSVIAASCSRVEDHAGADGLVRALVDEDERAGRAVPAVLVDEQRSGHPQAHPTHVVHLEGSRRLVARERVDVEPVVQVAHEGARRA